MRSGILILNKGQGISSQSAVTQVKRLFAADKAGHTGTLDPMATGVLPILIGRAVKASEFLLTGDKHYQVGLLLGEQTDTEDVTGKVLSRFSGELPDGQTVRDTVAGFLGESEQIPPMYSALKVGGRKLYDLARAGITVEREARAIRIDGIGALRLDERRYLLDVRCSKGTYMRTLCADIGRALGCGGCMFSLKRCEAAGFSLADAVTIEELAAMSEDERERRLLPIEKIFADLEKIPLSPFFARLARAGQPIRLRKIGVSLDPGARVRLYDGETFFALGEVRTGDEGEEIKPIRQFDL